MRDKFPVATPDEEWRMSSGNTYGGNALSPADVGTGIVQVAFASKRAGVVCAAKQIGVSMEGQG